MPEAMASAEPKGAAMNKHKKSKKLTLTSETLKNIGQPDLKDAAAGATTFTAPCTMCTGRCNTPCCP
jgi:hypothetical protein